MLCQFSVTNFKSIKEEIVLDMQATAISEHKDSLIIDNDGECFLPIAVIYGPNGSGKSNVLSAINCLVAKVMKPICSLCENESCSNKELKLNMPKFKFDDKYINMPTEFTVFFRTTKAEYRYILKLLKENIIFESLDKKNIDGVRYSSLFKRENKDKKEKIELNGVLKNIPEPEEISNNITLLSYLAITSKKNEVIKDVIGWFEGGIGFTNFGNPFIESQIKIPQDKEEIDFVTNILQEMDIDITGLRPEEESDDEFEVYTKHSIGDKEYELNLFEESAGTKKILGFLPDILNSLSNGITLIVDELDSKLHPVLIKYIIQLYTNKKINKHGAQLIFTSHDLANMNNDIYRRDEIWFIAKNNEQASNLYSLVELKDQDGNSIRKDARFDKQYLEGKYGADPYLKKIIDWGDE